MLKIAVVGCEKADTDVFKTLLTEYSLMRGILVSVRYYSDGGVLLADYFESFDIVLICENGHKRNISEFAERFRRIDMRASIIMVSSELERAIDGYAVNACDFLLMPIQRERLFEAMDRARDGIKNNKDMIMLKCVDSIVNISASEIFYIESNAHYLTYHTSRGNFVTRELMRVVEQAFLPIGFVRINHGYIVNIEHVSTVKDDYAVIANTELKISRARKAVFISKLEDYRRKQKGSVIYGEC